MPMMQVQRKVDQPDAGGCASPAMREVQACLGGRMRWRGRARGFLGLLDRRFSIDSMGEWTNGDFLFEESLIFDDGASEHREWRISENKGGLSLAADSIALIRPGRFEDGALTFEYRIRFGVMKFNYIDMFYRSANGEVLNIGRAKRAGLTLMRIEATGVRPSA